MSAREQREEKAGRGASRFLAHLPSTLHHEGRDYPCHARDLSRTGALLVGHVPIPVEPDVRFTLSNPSGDLSVDLAGRVVRVTEDDEGNNCLAVAFLPIDDVARPKLEALIARVVEGMAPAAFEELPPNPTKLQIVKALDGISVPHRIAMAGRAMPREREILIHDPHPQVIDALARNPNLLPQEALKLLRLPGLPYHTLDAMARDSRWGGTERFKILIAGHRNASLALVNRLVDTMGVGSLRKLVQMPGLHPSVRVKIVQRIPGL